MLPLKKDVIPIDTIIIEYLSRYKGEENALSSRELERVFQLDGRELRRVISRLRNKGVPICSSASGYFYAEKMLDIDRTVQSFNSRILEMQKARNGLVQSKTMLEDSWEGV